MAKHGITLCREEFSTLLQEAGAIVNSTPLYAGSGIEGEPLAVSPSMLLTLKTPSESDEVFTESDVQAYGRRRWRRVQVLAESFWKLWRERYLSELNQRSKWRKNKDNVKSGDIVILRDKAAPRASWRLARVVRVQAGRTESGGWA